MEQYSASQAETVAVFPEMGLTPGKVTKLVMGQQS